MIEIQVSVNKPMEVVWTTWSDPKHIVNWCSGHPDWHTREASNDLVVGGSMKSIMAAKDGSAEFPFEGVYTLVDLHKRIDYVMSDKRKVETTFTKNENSVLITQRFDPENENSEELQRQGWQNILNNFKSYTEQLK